MKYLLDADWIIHLLAGKQAVAARIQHLAPEDIAISLVTVAEVYLRSLYLCQSRGAFGHLSPIRE